MAGSKEQTNTGTNVFKVILPFVSIIKQYNIILNQINEAENIRQTFWGIDTNSL